VGEASYEEISHLGFTEASGSRLSSDDMDPCGSHCEQNWNPRSYVFFFRMMSFTILVHLASSSLTA